MRSPGESELFAGGEIPIHQRGHRSSKVTWRPYGLSLQLNSKGHTHDRVRIAISTELSHLDFQHAVENIPGVQINRMKTEIDAKFNEPLFLCGLLHSSIRKVARGIPLLQSIPILGKLFGSEEYMNRQSELVSILIPMKTQPKMRPKELKRYFPKGPIPQMREWLNPTEQKFMEFHPEFPWNILI